MLSSDPTNRTVVWKQTVKDQVWAQKARYADQIERELNQARAEGIDKKYFIAHKIIREYTTAEETTA